MITSHEHQIDCPECGEPMLVVLEAVSPDLELAYSPTYSGVLTEQECEHDLSDEQLINIAQDYFEGFSEDSSY